MQAEIFEIVDRALVRRWPRGGPRLIAWRAVWRANVRLRLLLTVRARVATGHGDAACVAWQTLTQSTGARVPGWLDEAGRRWIRRRAALQGAGLRGARESVSPL